MKVVAERTREEQKSVTRREMLTASEEKSVGSAVREMCEGLLKCRATNGPIVRMGELCLELRKNRVTLTRTI
jgi:hypothetical protein